MAMDLKQSSKEHIDETLDSDFCIWGLKYRHHGNTEQYCTSNPGDVDPTANSHVNIHREASLK